MNGTRSSKKVEEKYLSFFWVTILVFGVFAMLHPSYEVVASLFASMYQFKTNYSGLTSLYLVIPYLMLVSCFLYRQQRRESPSDYFIIILTLLYFIPGNILFVYGNWSVTYYIFHLLSYLSLSIANELFPNIQFPKSPSLGRNKGILSFISYFISISVILITLYYNGLQINLNLDEVYSLRNEWSASRMPNIFNYYLPFAARITPILLIITLKQRRVLLSSLLIFSQLVSFSFGGMKYTLFALVLGILFYFLEQKLDAKKIIIYFSVFVGVCLIECLIFREQIPLLTVYTLRRTSFIPNQIGFYFFSFAQENDYLYYSESFLRGFLNYPYQYAFPHIIGNYAFGLPDMGANTGLFAEGFSQIGWLSLPVYAILYVFVFRLYSACTRSFKKAGLFHALLLGVVLYSMTFIDGAYFSVLLTQGFLLSLVVFYFLSNMDSIHKYVQKTASNDTTFS